MRQRPPLMMTGMAALAVAGVSVFGLPGTAHATAVSKAPATSSCGVYFDDFDYSSSSDAALTKNGWVPRAAAGGPGVEGASWKPSNISFPMVDGQSALQLAASTDGTPEGTSQAELSTAALVFRDGTYATRIKFNDAPLAGSDGDHINMAAFVIGPEQRFDYDPLYSELDFSEYLPNGGYGLDESINYQTSYNGYRDDPWDPHSAESSQGRSYDGWHDIVVQVAGGHVRYYIDNHLLGDHTVDDGTGTFSVYPHADMALDFNMWFIDNDDHVGGVSTYAEQVDFVYYAKDQVLSPKLAAKQAQAFRRTGVSHTDSVLAAGCSGLGDYAVAAPFGICHDATHWRRNTHYRYAQAVRYKAHVWKATTDGTTTVPGDPSEWRDLGAC